MNNQRRKAITKQLEALALVKIDAEALACTLTTIRSAIEDIKGEEDDYYDNMPESLREGEKGEKAQAAINEFDNAMNSLETLLDVLQGSDLDDAESSLNTAAE